MKTALLKNGVKINYENVKPTEVRALDGTVSTIYEFTRASAGIVAMVPEHRIALLDDTFMGETKS